jgi:regulation of enolase protein 1 (concanavalin A-like superfamily)
MAVTWKRLVSSGDITNSDIASNAAISLTKLQSISAKRFLGNSASAAATPGEVSFDGNIFSWATSGSPSFSDDTKDGWTMFPSGAADVYGTYVSATSFTVPGDYSSLFTAGLKLMLKDSVAGYFYTESSSYSAGSGLTTVTVTGGSDYSVIDKVGTTNDFAIRYARGANPRYFPHSFAYTPTFTADSGSAPSLGNATVTCRFSIEGRMVMFTIYISFGSTSTFGSGGNLVVGLPVTPHATPWTFICNVEYYDQSVTQYYPRYCNFSNAHGGLKYYISTLALGGALTITNTTPFTWTTSDRFIAHGVYEMA